MIDLATENGIFLGKSVFSSHTTRWTQPAEAAEQEAVSNTHTDKLLSDVTQQEVSEEGQFVTQSEFTPDAVKEASEIPFTPLYTWHFGTPGFGGCSFVLCIKRG